MIRLFLLRFWDEEIAGIKKSRNVIRVKESMLLLVPGKSKTIFKIVTAQLALTTSKRITEGALEFIYIYIYYNDYNIGKKESNVPSIKKEDIHRPICFLALPRKGMKEAYSSDKERCLYYI